MTAYVRPTRNPASLRRRKQLVIAWTSALVVAAAAPLIDLQPASCTTEMFLLCKRTSYWAFPLALVAIALGVALNRSVTSLADMPDEHLDEREQAARDRSYLVAYRNVSAVLVLVLMAAYVTGEVATISGRVAAFGAVATWLVHDAWLVLLPLLFFAPSAALAWSMPDPPAEDPEHPAVDA